MFKESFKYYKSKSSPPVLDEVIDFDKENSTVGKTKQIKINHKNEVTLNPVGLTEYKSWKIFHFTNHPGLIFIKNPFTSIEQRYWIFKSLTDYPKPPNKSNLLPTQYSNDIIQNWWIEMQKESKHNRKLKEALRWTTLGYHYDWTNKIYKEQLKSDFPIDLNNLCASISCVLGYNNFRSQAAIVNYYPMGTTLAGHTDHSEVNLEAPLFSFSFGQTAIFLIGGKTLDEKPSAIMLKSGDTIVMSVDSRLCYHAVPRILKASEQPWNDDPTGDIHKYDHTYPNFISNILSDKVWAPYNDYISESRININVRQVLKEDQTSFSM